MLVGGGLVAQQVTVGTSLAQTAVTLAVAFAHGECYGAVGVCLSQRGNDVAQHLVGVIGVFASLQHEGTESEAMARVAALQDLVAVQAVAFHMTVSSTDATVVAVVATDIADFYKSADIDVVAKMLDGFLLGCLP